MSSMDDKTHALLNADHLTLLVQQTTTTPTTSAESSDPTSSGSGSGSASSSSSASLVEDEAAVSSGGGLVARFSALHPTAITIASAENSTTDSTHALSAASKTESECRVYEGMV